MTTTQKLSSYQHAALASFARKIGIQGTITGNQWKSELRHAWETGDYGGIDYHDVATLQTLRNASYFGPRGLACYKIEG